MLGKESCGVIVFGTAGAGKSTFLNQMMGTNKFKTASTAESVTKDGQYEIVNGLSVTDLPGFDDSKMSTQ